MNCPCQSGLSFAHCCERFLSHRETAETAEQLMRSRYTAFHRSDREYLIETWHPDHRPGQLKLDDQIRWIGLEIIDADSAEAAATVEFEARFLLGDRVDAMRERSSFLFQQGRWFYTTGNRRTPSLKPFKAGRNQACPCGSGLKFKRCCGR